MWQSRLLRKIDLYTSYHRSTPVNSDVGSWARPQVNVEDQQAAITSDEDDSSCINCYIFMTFLRITNEEGSE